MKGHGQAPNFADLNDPHIQIDVFAETSQVERIVQTIMNVAHTGSPGDGIIAVLPVERFYRIQKKSAPERPGDV